MVGGEFAAAPIHRFMESEEQYLLTVDLPCLQSSNGVEVDINEKEVRLQLPGHKNCSRIWLPAALVDAREQAAPTGDPLVRYSRKRQQLTVVWPVARSVTTITEASLCPLMVRRSGSTLSTPQTAASVCADRCKYGTQWKREFNKCSNCCFGREVHAVQRRAAPQSWRWYACVFIVGAASLIMLLVGIFVVRQFYIVRSSLQALSLSWNEASRIHGRGSPEYLAEVFIVPHVLTADECESIIALAEQHSWRTGRHSTYPTTDIATNSVPMLEKLLLLPGHRLLEQAARHFSLQTNELWLRDQFVVKYEPGAQAHLEAHRDASLISYTLALNDGFDGGGTAFLHGPEHTQPPRRLRAGDALVFCGKRFHEGRPVTRGTRYIVTGFLSAHASAETFARILRENPLTVDHVIGRHKWDANTVSVPIRPYLRANTVRLLGPEAMQQGDLRAVLAPGVDGLWPNAWLDSLQAAAKKVIERHGTDLGEHSMHILLYYYLTHYMECWPTFCHTAS